MTQKSPGELDTIARDYVSKHFPMLASVTPSRGIRQAKTPGAPCRYIYDFKDQESPVSQRLRLVLDAEGKILKATASR